MDIGTSLFTILAIGLGIVILVEFFHIGHLVSKVRGDVAAMATISKLRYAHEMRSSLTGVAASFQPLWSQKSRTGRVVIDGLGWNCRSETSLGVGAKVEVVAVDGSVLVVRQVVKEPAQLQTK
jgi:membrane-bound ClpP family serine protease